MSILKKWDFFNNIIYEICGRYSLSSMDSRQHFLLTAQVFQEMQAPIGFELTVE